MSIEFARHLASLQATGQLPLGKGLTDLGWCNALALAFTQTGTPAELMEVKAKSFRVIHPPHPDAYAEDFTFMCVKLPGSDPSQDQFVDQYGNTELADMARAEAQSRHWVFEETSRVQLRPDHLRLPEQLSESTADTVRYTVSVMLEQLAAFQAKELDQATPSAVALRSVRF